MSNSCSIKTPVISEGFGNKKTGSTNVFLVHLFSRRSVSVLAVLVIIISRSSGAVTRHRNTLVTLFLDLLMLAVEEVGLGAKHPRNTHEGEEKEEDLYSGLAGVKLFIGIDLRVGMKTSAWKVLEEVRRILTLPGERNNLMSMFNKLGGLRPIASQSNDHL